MTCSFVKTLSCNRQVLATLTRGLSRYTTPPHWILLLPQKLAYLLGRQKESHYVGFLHRGKNIVLWPPQPVSYNGLATLLHDLHVHLSQPSVLYCQNQSALHIATNPVFHDLDIDNHIVREKSQLRLLPIPSTLQIVNIFTKGAPIFSACLPSQARDD